MRSSPTRHRIALLVALAGAALSAVTLVVHARLESGTGYTSFCNLGGVVNCDAVLGSRWGKLLGLPTSFWGFLAYAALAAITFVKRAWLHWKLAFVVSFFGVLYSAYLTGVSLLVLHAACPYCLTSFALMTAAFALTIYQRAADLPRFSWPIWLAKTLPAALVVILALHLQYTGVFETASAPRDQNLAGLADYLTSINAKFYGASWCPHCQDQKRLFGAAAERLPYVECSPNGPRGGEAPACQAMQIQGYPTWIINGQRYEGVLSIENLTRLSGYAPK